MHIFITGMIRDDKMFMQVDSNLIREPKTSISYLHFVYFVFAGNDIPGFRCTDHIQTTQKTGLFHFNPLSSTILFIVALHRKCDRSFKAILSVWRNCVVDIFSKSHCLAMIFCSFTITCYILHVSCWLQATPKNSTLLWNWLIYLFHVNFGKAIYPHIFITSFVTISHAHIL